MALANHERMRNLRRRNTFIQDERVIAVTKIDNFTEIRIVRLPGSVLTIEYPILTVASICKLCDRPVRTYAYWIARGLIPSPILLLSKDSGQHTRVYHRDEAAAIVEELARHFRNVAMFLNSHIETIRLIHGRVVRVRSTLKLKDEIDADAS